MGHHSRLSIWTPFGSFLQKFRTSSWTFTVVLADDDLNLTIYYIDRLLRIFDVLLLKLLLYDNGNRIFNKCCVIEDEILKDILGSHL